MSSARLHVAVAVTQLMMPSVVLCAHWSMAAMQAGNPFSIHSSDELGSTPIAVA
jgi:hypothetical protein